MLVTPAALAFCAAITANAAAGEVNTKTICEHSQEIIDVSEQHRLDPYLLTAMIQVESGWNRKAVSPSGACGLSQVIPAYSKYNCEKLKNSAIGIKEGARILNYWLRDYAKGNLEVALCGYNRGFRCKGKLANRKGLTYARTVIKMMVKLKPKGEINV